MSELSEQTPCPKQDSHFRECSTRPCTLLRRADKAKTETIQGIPRLQSIMLLSTPGASLRNPSCPDKSPLAEDLC